MGFVEDEVFDQALKHFSAAGVVELAFCLWQFMGGNWFMHAIGVEPEGELTDYYGGAKGSGAESSAGDDS